MASLVRSLSLVAASFGALSLGLVGFVRHYELAREPLDLQTRAMADGRLEAFFAEHPAGERVVLLGDSLVFGEKLSETEGPSWPDKTLAAQLERACRAQGEPGCAALNLGVNGVLFSELSCLAEAALRERPERLVIHVSPRPFSSDFAVALEETERAFLCPPRVGSLLSRVSEEASYRVRQLLPVLRHRDLIQFRLLGETPRTWALTALDAWLLPAAEPELLEEDEDDAETAEILRQMAWRMKAAARLNSIRLHDDHPQARALARLLDLLAGQTHTRVHLFYLREHVDALAGQLDVARYERESQGFIDELKRRLAGTHVTFSVVDAAALRGHYTDHIHLDAGGYAELARLLLERER